MALTPGDLDAIAQHFAGGASLRAGIPVARGRHPGISFTCCDASDLGGEAPYCSCSGFDLYLVDGSGHCWQLTDDPAAATGVLLAEHAHA